MDSQWNLSTVVCFFMLLASLSAKCESISKPYIISCSRGLQGVNSDGQLQELGNHGATENFGKCQNEIFWPDKDGQKMYKGKISSDDREIVIQFNNNSILIKDFTIDCINEKLYILNGKMHSLDLFQLETKAGQTIFANMVDAHRIAIDAPHQIIYILYSNHIEIYTLTDQKRTKINKACIQRPTAVAFKNDDVYVAEEDQGIFKLPSDFSECTLILNYTGFILNLAVIENSLVFSDMVHICLVEVALDTNKIITNISVDARGIHSSSTQRLTINSILPTVLFFIYILS